ncbi:MAG: hypothetical protein ABJA84_00075 [Polaromonas sp.]
MAARGFLGAGDIYIERIVAGVPQGLAGPYYANKFEIKPNVETKDLISKGRNNYGQTLESVVLQQPADFSLELNEVNKESIALALLGTATATAQVAGTLADQAVVIKKDRWVSVTKENLGEAITVKNTAGTLTYVEGTDYALNRPLGLIKVLPASAIADAASLNVSGGYAAISSTVISGATNSDVRARIVFDGINQADGLPVIVRVHEAVIAADSAFDFLADDFNTVNLPGKLKTPTGKSEPFTVELRAAQA